MICSVLLLVLPLLMCLCQALIHDQQQSTINERDGLLNFNVNRRNLHYTRGHWTVYLVRPLAAPLRSYYYCCCCDSDYIIIGCTLRLVDL